MLTRGQRSVAVADLADDAAQSDRRAQAVDALPPTLLVASLVLLAVAPVHQLLEPGRPSLVLAAVCGGLAVVFAAARASFRSARVRALVARHPHEAVLAACVLASVAAASELIAFGRPTSAGGLVVFLLAAGVLTTRRRDALVVSSAVLVQWFAVAAAHSFSGAWVPLSVLVVCAAVLAHVLQVVRSRATDQLARAEALVLEAAVSDELTGLRNRRGLVGAGERLLRAQLGHAAGDRLVRAAAAVLLRTARSDDVVARIGGDEFAVLLPGTGGVDAAAARARLERALVQAHVPASVGSTTRPAGHRVDAGSVHVLLERADAAMYEDKQRRRAAPAVPGAGAGAVGRAPDQDHDQDHDDGRGVLLDPLLAAPGVASTAAGDLLGIARAAAWLHLLLVGVHVYVLPEGPGRAMAAVSLAVAALCALLLLRVLRTTVERRAEDLMAVVMVVLCAETVGYSALVSERWASLAVVLALISAGGTLAGRRRVGAVCGATTLAWLAVELHRGVDAETRRT